MDTYKGNTKKSVEKNVVSLLRSIGKLEGYKVSSNCLYKEQGDFFLYAVIYVRERNAQLYLNLTFNIKTMQEDDLFWNLLGMSGNSECAPGFRATGAFVVPSFQFDKKEYHIKDMSGIEQLCNTAINDFNIAADDFLSSVDGNENRYYQFILSQDNMIRGNLKKMIANILLKNYSKALQLAGEEISVGKRGGFENEGHDIYYFIEKYCKEKVTLKC